MLVTFPFNLISPSSLLWIMLDLLITSQKVDLEIDQRPPMLNPFLFFFVRIAYVEFYTPESVLMALAMSN